MNLILLTATFRGSNLPIVAKSISESVRRFDTSVNIYWTVCVDTTHWQCYCSWSEMEGMLNTIFTKFHIKFYPIVTFKDKVLGGDLYNEPLTTTIHNNSLGGNPWIYILDDDNILHPNLIEYVKRVDEQFPNKEIIWLTNMQRTGRIDGVINEDYAMQFTKSGSFFMNFPDPSTMVYRYEILSRYGLYATGGGSDYDRSTFVPMIGENLDKCVFASDLDPNMPHPAVHKVHAYHDALRTEEEFNHDFESFEKGNVEVCNFRVQTSEDRFPTQYHVPPALGEMILAMIKVYYDQRELTGHISRGEE